MAAQVEIVARRAAPLAQAPPRDGEERPPCTSSTRSSGVTTTPRIPLHEPREPQGQEIQGRLYALDRDGVNNILGKPKPFVSNLEL
jgi:hypothetical protein